MLRQCVGLLVLACLLGLAVAQEGSIDLRAKDGQPQWQRLLIGEDAKKAAVLQQKVAEAVGKDDDATALHLSQELLALRIRRQGVDHWETISQKFAVLL